MEWFVDGNNVMGSRPDGWWNNPTKAKGRLAQQAAEWCNTHDDSVTVVFDRPVAAEVEMLSGGNLMVTFARRGGRDAADDHIVTLVEQTYATVADITVVTADRGLTARLPPGVTVIGPRQWLSLIEDP